MILLILYIVISYLVMVGFKIGDNVFAEKLNYPKMPTIMVVLAPATFPIIIGLVLAKLLN